MFFFVNSFFFFVIVVVVVVLVVVVVVPLPKSSFLISEGRNPVGKPGLVKHCNLSIQGGPPTSYKWSYNPYK